jgi:hypothetical protein
MDPEMQNAFETDFPLLFRQGMYFECGPGWEKLIRDLCQELEPICQRQEASREEFILVATQVKEKFGGLRFYVHPFSEEVDVLIRKAEARSLLTCEVCGSDGSMRSRGRWLRTLCKVHGDAYEQGEAL